MANKPCRVCGAMRGTVTFRPERNICRPCESQYAAEYARNNPAWKRAANKRYLDTDLGRAALQRKGRRRAIRYPEKRQANYTVQTALRNGALVRQPCEQCGCTPTQAHHDDYSRPLDVRWLCGPCHRQEHIAVIAVSQKENSHA